MVITKYSLYFPCLKYILVAHLKLNSLYLPLPTPISPPLKIVYKKKNEIFHFTFQSKDQIQRWKGEFLSQVSSNEPD